MRNIKKIISLIFISTTLSGCVTLDDTDKVTITNKCLMLTEDLTLYVKNCPICKGSLAIMPSASYRDKPRELLDGSSRTFHRKLPSGTKIRVTQLKIVKGTTDGPPFYVTGEVIGDSNGETFDIPSRYFNFNDYPDVKPTGRLLKFCPN